MREIDVDELAAVLGAGALVVDVREASEYASGHVPGARSIPMSTLASRLDEVGGASSVFLVCASGNRSAAMASLLAAHGHDAVNVVGGTSAWVRSGRPLEVGA